MGRRVTHLSFYAPLHLAGINGFLRLAQLAEVVERSDFLLCHVLFRSFGSSKIPLGRRAVPSDPGRHDRDKLRALAAGIRRCQTVACGNSSVSAVVLGAYARHANLLGVSLGDAFSLASSQRYFAVSISSRGDHCRPRDGENRPNGFKGPSLACFPQPFSTTAATTTFALYDDEAAVASTTTYPLSTLTSLR